VSPGLAARAGNNRNGAHAAVKITVDFKTQAVGSKITADQGQLVISVSAANAFNGNIWSQPHTFLGAGMWPVPIIRKWY